jgi:hypothetical protein
VKAQISAPIEMSLHASLNLRYVKEISMLGRSKCHGFFKHWPQWSAEPVVRRNVKADLLPLQNSRTQFIAHQIPQNNFLPPPLDSE